MTRRFVLIGHPVGHSISPAIHGAAYRALGLDCTYTAVDCPDTGRVSEQIERLRAGEIAGANVTVPHKRLVLALADHADRSAVVTQAANVLCPAPDGGVIAHNTDAAALTAELEPAKGAESAVVIGSGGAALAAVVACRDLGVRRIHVVARRFVVTEPSATWPFAAEFSALGATLTAWPTTTQSRTELERIAARSRLFVQATSAGMKGADLGQEIAEVIPWSSVEPQSFAYDVVYNPEITPFIVAARARGLAASNGLGMLVGQAALALEIWLGVKAPLRAMQEAAEQALYGAGR